MIFQMCGFPKGCVRGEYESPAGVAQAKKPGSGRFLAGAMTGPSRSKLVLEVSKLYRLPGGMCVAIMLQVAMPKP